MNPPPDLNNTSSGSSYFKSAATRPPVPGSELGASVFTELPAKNPADKPTSICDNRTNSSKNMSELETAGGAKPKTGKYEREPEGSADITPPFSESSNSNSTPPYVRWAESFRNLVSDQDGMELFAKYLKSENVYFLLEFWFACEGLKKNNAPDITKLVKVINKRFIREQQVPVSEDTKRIIQDRIKNKDVERDIFDVAQNELESKMTETVYRNFLASDEYLNYVQKIQIGESDISSAKASGSHSTASSVSGRHIQDDSGHFSVPIEVDKARTTSSRPSEGATSRPSEAPGTTSDSTSGISESSSSVFQHSVATPSNTTSNTAQHNNTATTEASSWEQTECAAIIQSLSALPTLHENSELDLSGSKSFTEGSSTANPKSHSLLGLTSHSLMMTQKRRHVVKPEAYAGHYLNPVGGAGAVAGRNPYHAYNSAYNPVSRQDSELQSLSSDAHTTDDNMSSFTEGSSHSYRQITSKKHIKRQLRKAQEQGQQNREIHHGGIQAVVPRTQRVPVEATQPRTPKQFAQELIRKLEKVKEEQDKHERLQSKLEETTSIVSQDSSRSYAEYLKHNKLSFPDEPIDSILDKHFSSVSHFSDKTPVRTPGDPSGRPRTPPGNYRTNTSMGQMPPPPHRTLPGRVRGAGVPPMYHQDLAYFDQRREGGGSRMVGGRMEPPPPPQDNKNNFVREWVEDVERQSGGNGQYDQRSQTSRQSKTSPRSARHKQGGHRTQSTDRLMSASWSAASTGGGMMAHGQYQYQKGTQMQLEEANRRLVSLAHSTSNPGMYPGSHSNNSTLRRPTTGAKPAAPGAEFTVAVYTFSQEKEPMPYRIKIYTKHVTLANVKELLPKKGSFRFYFKTEVEGEACYEEETEDCSPVPLWEGKVIVQCRNME